MNTEREVVLRAIQAVMTLNNEAGTSNDSLAALLKVSEVERDRPSFDKFCRDVMASIHKCFTHFSTIMPQLAKVRAHRDFHQARLEFLPDLWHTLTTSIGLADIEPINLQAVCRELFQHCMGEFFVLLEAKEAPSTRTDVELSADEENVVRYASGYVGMKLMKQLRMVKGSKAAQYRECLSHMAKTGEDSSFYAYTTKWIDTVNRGGLFEVNDGTYNFFKAVEVKTRQLLPQHLIESAKSKEWIIEAMLYDNMVQAHWKVVAVDVVDEEDCNDLLRKIVDMWITMRGFSIVSNWMDAYKRVKDKTLKKAKSLRQGLKASECEEK